MPYQYVSARDLKHLPKAVEEAERDGWKPIGTPFQHDYTGTWCMGMTKAAPPANGDVKLREPEPAFNPTLRNQKKGVR